MIQQDLCLINQRETKKRRNKQTNKHLINYEATCENLFGQTCSDYKVYKRYTLYFYSYA